MVAHRIDRIALECKLDKEEIDFQKTVAKNYLHYFGNTRPSKEQLDTMQALINSHWLKRTIQFPRKLTEREKECLYYLMQGKNRKETALLMAIAPETIKVCVRSILKKLECRNIKEAIAKAVRYEIVKRKHIFYFA